MKHLIIILLAFVTLSVQAQKKDRIVNNKITPDSISTQIARVDTLKFNDGTKMSTAGGSTITASDGVYMDGDTIKLGGSVKGNYTEITTNDNATTGIALNYENQDNITFFASENIPYGFQHTLKFDTTGLYFTSIDTTLTTPNHLMTEAQTKREINAMQPTNNIFSWDAVNKWYAPYYSKQASMSFYTGTTDPTLTTRLNLDGLLYINGLVSKSSATISVPSGTALTAIGDDAVVGNAGTGSGIWGVSSSNKGVAIKATVENNTGLYITQNNNSTTNNDKPYLRIDRAITSGTRNLISDFISITDNPTTSGTISGKVLSATIGSTERISLNPRATSTTTPYIFQTHNKPTANLFEFGIQGRNKVSADTTGHVTFKGTYASIYRHKSLGDTTQSIPTGATPTKVLAFSTNGEQSNCIVDKDNDKITITKTGRYMVNLSLSYASGTNAVNWTAYIFKAGTECENMHSTGSAMSGIINVTSVPCDIDYRVSHSHGSAVDLIMTYVNLNVNYIGD